MWVEAVVVGLLLSLVLVGLSLVLVGLSLVLVGLSLSSLVVVPEAFRSSGRHNSRWSGR